MTRRDGRWASISRAIPGLFEMLLPCTGDAVRGGTSNGFQLFDFS